MASRDRVRWSVVPSISRRRRVSPPANHPADFSAFAQAETPFTWSITSFYNKVTSPDSGLGAFTSGDVRDIAYYADRADEYLLMRVRIHNEGVAIVWVRVERPLFEPNIIQFSTDRSKLWKPSDDDIMASVVSALKFRHVIDLLNILPCGVTNAYRIHTPTWYAGIVIGILHGGFGKSWVNLPPPDWFKIARYLFGSEMATATQFVERKFAIRHPNIRRISLMEPVAWENEPTPPPQPPSSRQDHRKGADPNSVGAEEKIAHVGSASTSSQGHLSEPRPVQSPKTNGAVPANGADAKKNGDGQPRGPEMKIPSASGIHPSNVLPSEGPGSPPPHDPHHPSKSPTGNPLSDQIDERKPMEPTSASSTPTSPSQISPKEGSTGIDKAPVILPEIMITAPSAEDFGQGPRANPSFTNAPPSPPETPNLTGRIRRLGSTPIATGGYSSVWRGMLLSAPSDDPDRALQVAIKVLRPSHTDESTAKRKLDKRLRVEMRIWSQLCHENVVKLLGHTKEPEGPGLVSISYPHGNVLSFLEKNPSVNREIICADVALGLQYLHEHKPPIIHGDLKGPNVLIDAEGRASICDFGLSIILDGGPTGHTSSIFGGSLRFLAPELLYERTRTVETDIYAYACTCIQILFDLGPYQQLSEEAHLMRAILDPLRPPFDPSNENVTTFPSVLQILKCCWDHDRSNRPSVNSIIDTLQRCLYRTYRTNLSVHQGIGKRVRFMCLPGIEQAKLIWLEDGGLSIVVDCSSSFHRVPIYQRYRWELMDGKNLQDWEDGSNASSSLAGKDASSALESPPYVLKWREYSVKFRLPYSSMVSYESYHKISS